MNNKLLIKFYLMIEISKKMDLIKRFIDDNIFTKTMM